MNDALTLSLVFVAGAGLGTVFFVGLWLTVVRGLSSSRSAFWFFTSMLLRTGVVVWGFYLVGAAHWERLLACLLGFLVARIVITRLVRGRPEGLTTSAKEVRHAP